MTKHQKIAIAGCGIGGLTAAILLLRSGRSVEVFDQFETPAPVGSGLVIQPVGQAVLQEVGVLDLARSYGAAIKHLVGHRAPDNRLVLSATYGERAGLAIHRASLFAALFDQATKAGMALKPAAKVVSSHLEGDQRFLKLENGETHGPFDLVIDATGARSALSPIENKTLPFGALWATVDWPEETTLPADTLNQKYRSSSVMAGVLPIGRMPGSETKKATIFWSIPNRRYAMWMDSPLSQWQVETIAHWPEFAPFVQQLKNHRDFTMASYTHGQLRNPVAHRLVHIGDAAHTASPQLGQGANMALLDAYALSNALGKFDIGNALEFYSAARRNHTRIYQAISRIFTPLYQSESRLPPVIRDSILAPSLRLPLAQSVLTRLIYGDIVPPIQAGLPDLTEI